jgi:uncharacterized protein YgiB involved in biofilm formation
MNPQMMIKLQQSYAADELRRASNLTGSDNTFSWRSRLGQYFSHARTPDSESLSRTARGTRGARARLS